MGHQNVSQANSPEPDTENEENILQSDELGSVHSLYSKVLVEEPEQPNKSMDSTLRNDTPQSIPLADLDGELKLSTQSISSLKSSGFSGGIMIRLTTRVVQSLPDDHCCRFALAGGTGP